jgi:hypothetical protein
MVSKRPRNKSPSDEAIIEEAKQVLAWVIQSPEIRLLALYKAIGRLTPDASAFRDIEAIEAARHEMTPKLKPGRVWAKYLGKEAAAELSKRPRKTKSRSEELIIEEAKRVMAWANEARDTRLMALYQAVARLHPDIYFLERIPH